MTDDDKFRVILFIIGSIFVPVGLYHRLRAHTGEKIDRWQEGVVILFGARLTALVVLLAGIAWLINPAWMAWSHLPIPISLRWAGVAIAICGVILWVWTVHHLGPNLTDTVVTRQKHSLVTSGPYRWVRHPFYVAGFVLLCGGCLAMANWFVLMGGMIVFAFLAVRTRIEERNLIERFGDEYRTYMRRVGRFVPRLTRGDK